MTLVMIVLSLTMYEIFTNQTNARSLTVKTNGEVQEEENAIGQEMFDSILEIFFQNFSYTATYV